MARPKRTLRHLAFTGDLKDLKTWGFTFQKLYARNYNCWHKKVSAGSNHIFIWHAKRDVELVDAGIWSCNLMEALLASPKPNKYGFYEWRLGHETGVVDSIEHHNAFETRRVLGFTTNGIPVPKEEADEYYKKYRRVSFDDTFGAYVLDLWNNGALEIRNDLF